MTQPGPVGPVSANSLASNSSFGVQVLLVVGDPSPASHLFLVAFLDLLRPPFGQVVVVFGIGLSDVDVGSLQ